MITIDIGNSRIKYVVFECDQIIDSLTLEYDHSSFESQLEALDLVGNAHKIIISYVAGNELRKKLESWLDRHDLNDVQFAQSLFTQCGVNNSYENPACLGVDRWLGMIAAYHHAGREKLNAVCVVDCGTAITIDVIDKDGQHLGGLIMPGYQTMIASLISSTGDINKVKASRDIKLNEIEFAKSTTEAVEQGCSQLMLNGVTGVIKNFQKIMMNEMLCVVTGGDGLWVSKECGFENIHDTYLVNQGLRIVFEESKAVK